MPEIAEVYQFAHMMRELMQGTRIEEIRNTISDTEYGACPGYTTSVRKGVKTGQSLVGAEIKSVARKGKKLWVDWDGNGLSASDRFQTNQ